MEPDVSRKLAKAIVGAAKENCFFDEYDPESNSGKYENMPKQTYLEELTTSLAKAIQDLGINSPEKILDQTENDWYADDTGEFDHNSNPEILEYISIILLSPNYYI